MATRFAVHCAYRRPHAGPVQGGSSPVRRRVEEAVNFLPYAQGCRAAIGFFGVFRAGYGPHNREGSVTLLGVKAPPAAGRYRNFREGPLKELIRRAPYRNFSRGTCAVSSMVGGRARALSNGTCINHQGVQSSADLC